MRLILSLVILSLMLVACGNEETTGGVSSDPTVDASNFTPTPNDFEEQQAAEFNATEEVVDEEGNVIIVTPQAQVLEGMAPLPGTLVHDSEFVDENMGAVFDRIVFVRSGGGESAPTYLLKLKQDGSYELNRETLGQVDSETISRLDTMLDEINFFGISTPMLGPGAESDNYRYTITVERGLDEMTIRAEDGFTPQPVMQLFGVLLGIIADSENTAVGTPLPTGA